MEKLSATTLGAVLIAVMAQGAQAASPHPLFEMDGTFRDAAVHGDHLFLLASEVPVGQPDVLVWHPPGGNGLGQQVGGYTARYAPLAMAAAAGWMYLAEGDAGLEVADIRNPANPRRAVHLPLAGYTHRVVLHQSTALVASGFGGLHLLDIRDPARPELLSSYQDFPSPRDSPEHGKGSSGSSADEGAPEPEQPIADPVEDGGYFRPDDLPAFEGIEEEITPQEFRDREGVLDVTVEGTIAYLACGSAGIVILDISDPRKPRRIAGYQTGRPPKSILVRDAVAFLTAGVEGLLIFDVADPSRPKRLAKLRTPCYPKRLGSREGILYLADGSCGEKGLLVIDVQAPTLPRVVEHLSGRIENVRVLGNLMVSLGVHKARVYSLPSL